MTEPLRLATLERVSSYSAVSAWWSAASSYYFSAKNSENQTVANTVDLVERLATPALRGLSRVPEYCPEGIVETVDGVAVNQLDRAESLVASGAETVSRSTSYALSTKDAAVARGTEMYNNSTSYVLSTKDAAIARGCETYNNSASYVLSTKDASVAFTNQVCNNTSSYVNSTKDAAIARGAETYNNSTTYILSQGNEALAKTNSRVEEWRNALKQRFAVPKNEVEEGEKVEMREPKTAFDYVQAVYPGIVQYDGDRVLMPLKNFYEGIQQRRIVARQMFAQAQETGENQVRATREFIQPAIAQPSETLISMTGRFLEQVRGGVTTLEKCQGTNPDSPLLRQLDYIPSSFFAQTTTFLDGLITRLDSTTPVVVEENQVRSSEEDQFVPSEGFNDSS